MIHVFFLTLSRPRPISYRKQSIDLLCKSMDWFLYDIGFHHERVKLSSDTTATTLQELFNESLSNCEFPGKLKLVDITPVFKKKNPLDKASYRPLSVLPPISKIYGETITKANKQ